MVLLRFDYRLTRIQLQLIEKLAASQLDERRNRCT